jgi:uncharacterized HAD superfamily protein
MKQAVIMVDFDDVVAAFNQAYVAHHNQYYQTPYLTYDDIRTFDMTTLYGVDQKTIISRVRRFCHEYHGEIMPWSGAAEGLNELYRKYDLHILTSRCESLRDITEAWLVDHGLRDVFSELHFTNGFGSLYPDRMRRKLEVCLEMQAVAMIEDAPTNAQQVADGGVPVLMPDRPWNRGFEHPLVRRFYHMSEISSLVS